MPRHARYVVPLVPLHIVHRGVNRERCFRDGADFRRYLEYLEEGSERAKCAVHAFVLMDNHVHLLATPTEAHGGGIFMKHVAQGYTQFFNARWKRSGPLWEGRFHSSLVDSETYLLRCHRYIEMNPVRAGMVRRPEWYPWSSHMVNAWGQASQLIALHPMVRALSPDPDERMRRYRAFFDVPGGSDGDDAIREAAQGSFAVGSTAFIERIEEILGRRVTRLRAARPRRTSAVR